MTKDMPKEIWAGGSKLSCDAGNWTAHEDCAKYYEAIKYLRADAVAELKCFYEDDLPSKFIAIYSDGSGCEIFYKVSDGFYSTPVGVENVQKDWFTDTGYLWFVPLPDSFEVWRDSDEKK